MSVHINEILLHFFLFIESIPTKRSKIIHLYISRSPFSNSIIVNTMFSRKENKSGLFSYKVMLSFHSLPPLFRETTCRLSKYSTSEGATHFAVGWFLRNFRRFLGQPSLLSQNHPGLKGHFRRPQTVLFRIPQCSQRIGVEEIPEFREVIGRCTQTRGTAATTTTTQISRKWATPTPCSRAKRTGCDGRWPWSPTRLAPSTSTGSA